METVPLDDTWRLYLHYKDLGSCYNENMEKLMDISDIVTFWQTINNIPATYDIFSDGINVKKMKRNNATPCSYSFFRTNTMPCWEDPNNCEGFEFSIKNNRDFNKFQENWINSLVELISESNPDYKYIQGIRAVDCTKYNSVMYRMEFWISDESVKDSIEKLIKNNFKIYSRLMYKSHKNIKETV